MVVQTGAAAGDHVRLTLYNDHTRTESIVTVSRQLAALLAYADAWARQESRDDDATLSFSSTLAAMVAGDNPLSGWLRLHLALRGSAAEVVTKGRTFPNLPPLTGRLTTTHSFRRALEQAIELARGRTLDVRHMMAAYPVVKDYHARDFLRFRIDRRAWCLALADHLQRTEAAEAQDWKDYEQLAPEVLLPRYRPDLPAGADLLGVGREVEAFAMLIAASRTAMPLSIGVFGAWGSGKSYFMTRVEERVAALAQTGARGGPYLRRIAQVRFNAWHYSEGDVVASLVDQIFRNLRFGPDESSVVLAQRRAEALAQVAAADQELRALESQARAAAEEELQLRQEWQRLTAEHETAVKRTAGELETAQASVKAAEQLLADAVAAQGRAIDNARRTALASTAFQQVANTVLEDPTVATLHADLTRARKEAEWAGANWRTIAWGVAVMALTGTGIAVVQELRNSAYFVTLAASVAAAAPFASKAVAVLRDLSERGARFHAAVLERTQAEITRSREEGERRLQEHEAALAAARATVDTLRERLQGLADAGRHAQQALADGEARRQQVNERLTAAALRAAAQRRQLDATTLGSLLGDTISEAAGTDLFRKQLGTLSSARTYFQRLSETMGAARRNWSDGTGAQPVLERVVLYIDDLDRCPAPKVREVLQTVHLLLAFDLFACVVAVDPRWVLQCLAESPGVNVRGEVRDADLEVLGGVATPSDYLEKIFQIPLWLRPVLPERRAALAATLLERDLEGGDRNERAVEAIQRELAGENPYPPETGDHHTAPAPHEVRIDTRELQFLQTRVAPLLDGNARALKRFVNTYHLVKAALSEVEFDYFANHDPYRVCMAQLAVLATQRRRARLLAKLVDEASQSPPGTLGKWLDALAKQSAENGSIAHDLSSALLPDLEELPFDRFTFWFERTRRYSFYL